jgi:hypothetical protein
MRDLDILKLIEATHRDLWMMTLAIIVAIVVCSLSVGLTISQMEVNPPAYTTDILIPGGMD